MSSRLIDKDLAVCNPRPTDRDITVHLVFKTHLDLGFTDLARNVADHYLENYIPQALEVARRLRADGAADRFIWTTGSWLIYEYLERASPSRRTEMERAIGQGDIVWHALPFTTHTELMDPPLFRHGLSLAGKLDARFGRKTTAAKMTDVPGHTRAIVPLLADAGITFLHIGVNPACAMPQVPPIFRWRDAESESEIVVMYNPDYGTSSAVPGSNAVLWVSSTGDNHGPSTGEQVLALYESCRSQFPGARVIGSTLDAFSEAIRPVVPILPIVTDEIGDTWIHGVGTDPGKVAAFRELLRLRQTWLHAGRCDRSSLGSFHDELLKVAEHTWGLDEKTFLNDFSIYSKADFNASRDRPEFRKMETSWQEQRDYIDRAITLLPSAELISEARGAMDGLGPVARRRADFRPIVTSDLVVDTKSYQIYIDAATGAVTRLFVKSTGQNWASPDNPLCLMKYGVYGSRDYDRFLNQYVRDPHLQDRRGWAITDLSKPGLENVLTDGAAWTAAPVNALIEDGPSGDPRLFLNLAFPDECSDTFGAPRRMTLQIGEAGNGALEIIVQWFDKSEVRIPEDLWLSFTPAVTNWGRWSLDKMGSMVSPYAVVSKGARHLHAVSDGVEYREGPRRFRMCSLDAPLVALGSPDLLNFDDRIASPSEGVHVNLYNNVWGTNFPMWMGRDARFRFQLILA